MRLLSNFHPWHWVFVVVIVAVAVLGVLNVVLDWLSPWIAVLMGLAGLALLAFSAAAMWNKPDQLEDRHANPEGPPSDVRAVRSRKRR